MKANNMEQLKHQLLKEMKRAMDVTAKKALGDMCDETWGFYEGKQPYMYIRTGALGDTPRVTSPTTDESAVSFEASLDTSHVYSTGKNPPMEDVLNLANYGIENTKTGTLGRTVGRKGFWERAEKKMEKTLDDTMGEFFK